MNAVKHFLKLEGIEGDSLDSRNPNEIELLSFRWTTEPAGPQRESDESVHFREFRAVSRISLATPKLIVACARRRHCSVGVLTCRPTSDENLEYIRVEFRPAHLFEYEMFAPEDAEVSAVDRFTFRFSNIVCEYKRQKYEEAPSGAIYEDHDFLRNIC
jgi:type VI protein secretion system component Hcp